jgi:Rap1a immunity proteins
MIIFRCEEAAVKILKMIIALPILVTFLQPSSANANFLSGNDLFRSCSTEKDSNVYYQEQARCYAYILGSYDTLDLFGRVEGTSPLVCSPNGLVANQVVDIVVAYLKNNPETRHWGASDIVMMALSKSFPCKKQQ